MLRSILLALLMSLSTPSLLKSSTSPLIVAHRGASADAPENTLPAFQLAWQQGADAIEGDFHLTRDKQVVCIHNPTTGSYAKQNLTVRKSTLAQLKALDVGTWKSPEFAGTSIPTLAEVLTTVPPDKKLYIEIKSSPKIVRHLLKVIDSSDIAPSQIVIIAFSGRVIKAVKSQRPSLKAILLATPRHRDKSPNLVPTPQHLVQELRRTKADGLSLYCHPHVDADYLAPILEAGYELHTWTVDKPETARQWLTLGAQSLTTNTPGSLRATLAP
ncbi:glycerophosphodiester phosphodiesterase [Pelagicoccus mobilis]|uniref:Glycerophosphodiester phosphodiesterase n=1 Tax=Pelagicoccus mobilis TaxID=415221 RepID=A0A934RVD6_9BACT|nr:glycerophosphodiester phosphodiesterase [Pelagicoccus mobilis]MBK1878395.1 glycerophosphodiester phosphodiesterase [Pelagicoccus mobilis]